MPPDEREWLPPPEPTSRLWDTFLAGEPSAMDGPGPRSRSSNDVDPAIAETIRRFHALDDAPAPDAALTERIWQEALRRQTAERLAAANGHRATGELLQTEMLARPGAMPAARRWPAAARRLTGGLVREVGIGVLAGFVAGLIAIGGGARLIMRVLAMTADPALQGTLTENGERVGEVTFGGTLMLLFAGAFIGAGGGAVYALVKPWLPWSGWRRGTIFGLLLAATFGSLMLEGGDNPDYRRFGVPFLNVCLFNLLPVAFGLLVVPIADRLERALATTRFAGSTRSWALAIAAYALLSVAALPVALLLIPLVAGADPLGLIVVALVLSRAGIARWVGRFERPSDLLARPAAFVTAYAILLLPALVGLVLTLRAAGRILSG